jgi:hypothetical protein
MIYDKLQDVSNFQNFIHEGKKLVKFELAKERVTILATDGLREIQMPVPEKEANKAHIELYFCLPSYWDNEDESLNFQWPKDWLVKLWKHIEEKETWLGHGHTIRCYPDYRQISENMKMNHFFLSDPILLEEELKAVNEDEKTIHFISIFPIFGEEMDYKQGKGTRALLKKFKTKGISEKLDDYRESILKGRMRFF